MHIFRNKEEIENENRSLDITLETDNDHDDVDDYHVVHSTVEDDVNEQLLAQDGKHEANVSEQHQTINHCHFGQKNLF